MRVLIFGGPTPLAHRLAYYIQAYAKVKEVEASVVLHPVNSEATLASIQRAVWKTYVSGEEQGRPEIIINVHEQDKLALCETDPTSAWLYNTTHAAFIAYAARTANVPLIQWSSDHVFRGVTGPYEDSRDTASEAPVNIYGVTKWYAERIATFLYPKRAVVDNEWIDPGTTIVRTSDLYGSDVPGSIPAQLHHNYGNDQVEVHGVVRNPARVSPSFIGEVAFLFARNLILSPQTLNVPVIHLAPPLSTTWAQYLHSVGCDVVYQEVGELSNKQKSKVNPSDHLQRQGPVRGLQPTSGWVLPADPNKSFKDFLSEYHHDGEWIRYWDAH